MTQTVQSELQADSSVATAKIADGAVTANKLASNAVTTTKITDANVTAAKLANGPAIQTVSASSGALATGTTTIPADDTIPQNTEGTALAALDVTITPTSATSKLLIQAVLNVSASAAVQIMAALFQDSTANALAAADWTCGGAGQIGQLHLTWVMAAGTTSATTFKVRYGPASAATVTINGSGGARLFGGVMLSSLTVTEFKG